MGKDFVRYWLNGVLVLLFSKFRQEILCFDRGHIVGCSWSCLAYWSEMISVKILYSTTDICDLGVWTAIYKVYRDD